MAGTGLTAPGAGAPDGPGSRWGRLTARRRWGAAAVAIAAVTTGSLAFWLGGGPGGAQAAGGPQATTARHGEVWLQGTITQDGPHSATILSAAKYYARISG